MKSISLLTQEDMFYARDRDLSRLPAFVNVAKPKEPRTSYEMVDYTPITGDSLIPDGGGVTFEEIIRITYNNETRI